MLALVPASPPAPAAWQDDYRAARLTTAELLAHVGLNVADLPYGLAPAPDFALKVPPHFRSLIRRGDPHDPLLLQVLARADELVDDPARLADPLDEQNFTPSRGILRKYGSRALLIAASSCAIHCRYCFRRHTDYGAMVLTPADQAAAVAALKADPAIIEVILSGGDPLTLSDDRLAGLLTALDAIPHLAAIRIHTRTLTSVPARVTPALTALLAGLGKPVVIVTHTNHAEELDTVVADALGRLREAGVTLLNQSVLLRGVNDTAASIGAHALRLFACGVLPYYMHLMDPVAGAGHFDVGLAEALALEQALRDTLPGYLVPRFVREVPGRLAKTPIWQLWPGAISV
ncbi:MAG: KamA family radical SAM protein [Polymorphobacter sp.]